MAFQGCSYTDTVRSAAAVATQTDLTFGAIANASGGCIFWLIRVASRTVGTLTATALGSFDGSTYFSLGTDQEVSTTVNGNVGFPLTGPTPRYIGLRLTPSGGFDGTAQVDLYTAAGAQSATT